jgi:hypothetical protein
MYLINVFMLALIVTIATVFAETAATKLLTQWNRKHLLDEKSLLLNCSLEFLIYIMYIAVFGYMSQECLDYSLLQDNVEITVALGLLFQFAAFRVGRRKALLGDE